MRVDNSSIERFPWSWSLLGRIWRIRGCWGSCLERWYTKKGKRLAVVVLFTPLPTTFGITVAQAPRQWPAAPRSWRRCILYTDADTDAYTAIAIIEATACIRARRIYRSPMRGAVVLHPVLPDFFLPPRRLLLLLTCAHAH
jgi:hypothetical protein